eukprot:PhF_6_TR38100/c0_g1_i3/m.56843
MNFVNDAITPSRRRFLSPRGRSSSEVGSSGNGALLIRSHNHQAMITTSRKHSPALHAQGHREGVHGFIGAGALLSTTSVAQMSPNRAPRYEPPPRKATTTSATVAPPYDTGRKRYLAEKAVRGLLSKVAEVPGKRDVKNESSEGLLAALHRNSSASGSKELLHTSHQLHPTHRAAQSHFEYPSSNTPRSVMEEIGGPNQRPGRRHIPEQTSEERSSKHSLRRSSSLDAGKCQYSHSHPAITTSVVLENNMTTTTKRASPSPSRRMHIIGQRSESPIFHVHTSHNTSDVSLLSGTSEQHPRRSGLRCRIEPFEPPSLPPRRTATPPPPPQTLEGPPVRTTRCFAKVPTVQQFKTPVPWPGPERDTRDSAASRAMRHHVNRSHTPQSRPISGPNSIFT